MQDEDVNTEKDEEREESHELLVSTKKKKKKKGKSSSKSKNDELFLPWSPLRNKLFRVIKNDDFGRHSTALSNIAAGTCVLRETPFAFSCETNDLCRNCGAFFDDLFIVDIGSHFCSEKCELQYTAVPSVGDSSIDIYMIANTSDCDHKLLDIANKILRKHSQTRLLDDALFHDDGDIISSTNVGFFSLEDHTEKQSDAWKNAVQNAFSLLLDLSKAAIPDSNHDLALATTSRINVNAFGMSNLVCSAHVAVGMFPVVAMVFNHSCRPNLVYHYCNVPKSGSSNTRDKVGVLEVRACRDIAQGEELCVSYIDILQNTTSRRAALRAEKFFTCRCVSCVRHDEIAEKLQRRNELDGKYGVQDVGGAKSDVDELDFLTNSSNQMVHLSADELSQLMFGGGHCRICGVAGVLVQVDANACVCAICGQRSLCNISEIENLTLAAWNQVTRVIDSHIKSASSTNASAQRQQYGQQALQSLERFLSEFDPSFDARGALGGLPPSTLERIQRTASTKPRLHSNHSLFILNVTMKYCDVLLCLENQVYKTSQILRKSLQICLAVVGKNMPELINFQSSLVKAIDTILLEKKIPKNTQSSLRKEMNELSESIRLAREICYGAN